MIARMNGKKGRISLRSNNEYSIDPRHQNVTNTYNGTINQTGTGFLAVNEASIIADYLEYRSFAEHTIIHNQGDPGDTMNMSRMSRLVGPLVNERTYDNCQNGSFKEMLKNKVLVRNIVIVVILNVCASIDYYLVTFSIKYMKGDVYANNTLAGVGEIISYFLSVVLFEKLGFRKTFILCFITGAIGGMVYLNFADSIGDYVFMIILLQQIGIGGAFNLCFLANCVFPPLYQTTVFGICNLFCRLATVVAPQVAEMSQPVPMIIYTTVALIGAGVSITMREMAINV
jgi:multidrug transporter EmrE-like cation transporter